MLIRTDFLRRAVALCAFVLLAGCSLLSTSAMPDNVRDGIAKQAAVARAMDRHEGLTHDQALEYIRINALGWTELEDWVYGREGSTDGE